MEKLTKIEEQYVQELYEGKLDSFDKVRVLAQAFNEGRFKHDLSDPKAKAWDEKYEQHLAHMKVWSLQGKRERKIPLTKEQIKILEDYEENGVLPPA